MSQAQAKTVGPVRKEDWASMRRRNVPGRRVQAPGQEQLDGLRACREARLQGSKGRPREVTLGCGGALT